MLPRSPCKQSFAEIEKDGLPTEDRVDAIFEAIRPLLPTPHRIILDWQFVMALTAFSKLKFIDFFNFCRASISKFITSKANDFNFFFIFNVTKYLL